MSTHLVTNALDSAESIAELPFVEVTIEEINKSKFNSMIGLIDRDRVDEALYGDFETVKAREKRLAKESCVQEIQAKNVALGKKVKEPASGKANKGRGDASYYRVTCKDNGRGMPHDDIPNMFGRGSVQGGGNAGNALTCVARLGLNARLISKVSNDAQGRGVLEELQVDGVDVSYFVVSEEGNTPFTYVIVDNQTKTRTCIHTPGSPRMIPDDLKSSTLLSAINGANLAYFDVRLHETALVIAHEENRRGIPIFTDAEKLREGLDDLLSDYVVCSAKLPQAWTEASTVPSALVSMLLKLPKVKFVIVTLGQDGCIMLKRSIAENCQADETDVDTLVELLKQKIDRHETVPTSVSSDITRLHAKGIGTVCGRLFLGTAEKIPESELVDTTGAGDAFIWAILYAR